jgi:Trk K+ transport system NAD-binding subunit
VAAGKLTSRAILDQLVDEGFQQFLSHLGSGVELIELLMSADADGIAVSDLEIEGKLRVAAVRRGLETFVGDADLLLEEDDLVVAAAVEGIRRKVRRYLKAVDA